MDDWLKESNDNVTKPTANDFETAVKTNVTPKCNSKKRNLSEKNEASHTKKRLYNDSFLQYGFTVITENCEHCPLCLICNKVSASESLKPGKLKRHLQTEHDSYRNRPVEFFHRLLQTWEKQRQSFESDFIDEGFKDS